MDITDNKYYVFGYKPSHSPMYFYISIGKDPHANFDRDVKQERNSYGQVAGNKAIHKRINYWNKQVRLDIIASTDEQDVAHKLKNYLLYFCQKSVIFNGNHLTRENYARLGSELKSLYKFKQFELLTQVGCFSYLDEVKQCDKQVAYKNWNNNPIPKNWQVVDGWVVPDEFAAFMPPEEITSDPYFGGVIYLLDGTGYNLRSKQLEEM